MHVSHLMRYTHVFQNACITYDKKAYVKCMVLDLCVERTFYDVRLTHVLRTVNVCCTFCCVRLIQKFVQLDSII